MGKNTRYTDMIGQSGSTPHDIYDDRLEELNEKYKDDRQKIKKWAKGKGLVVTSTSTYEWFHDQLQDEKDFLAISEEHRTLFFDTLLMKAREQDEENERNAKKSRKKFVELMQRTRDITAKTTYEKAGKMLGKDPAWSAVDESTRKQCFDIFVEQLKIQASKQADVISEDESVDDRRKAKEKKVEKDVGKTKKRRVEVAEEEEPKKKRRSTREEVEDPPEKAVKKSKKAR